MKKKKVLEIYKNVEKLKEYYPKAFKEEELEVGFWYKNLTHKGSLFFYDGTKSKDGLYYCGYGFDCEKFWCIYDNFGNWSTLNKYKKATPQEIGIDLIKEAKKRGFEIGTKFKNMNNRLPQTVKSSPYFKIDTNSLHVFSPRNEWECSDSNPIIFQNGTWATIIEPK